MTASGRHFMTSLRQRGLFEWSSIRYSRDLRWSAVQQQPYSSSNASIIRSPFPDVQVPDKTFVQLIWQRHHQWGNKIAAECGITGEKYTYEELLDRAESIGSGLLSRSVARGGDVLAFLLPNTPDYVATLLGAAWAGLTICSINPLYTADEIRYQLKNSGAKSIITFPDKVPDVLKATRCLLEEGALASNFQVISIRGLDGRKMALPCGVESLEDFVKVGKSRGTNGAQRMDSLAFIAHSSGTTGLPKGVCLSHANVTASLVQLGHKETSPFQETTGSQQDVIPLVLPIFHNFGLEVILQALYHGSKIVTLPNFEEKSFLSNLKKQKATLLFVVPPIALFLGSNKNVKEEHFEHLRVILAAAAPIGEEDILRCLRKAPSRVNFIQGYGQTEAMCCITFTPYNIRNYKTVGLPVVNTEIKFTDIQSGISNPAFKEGELCFRGPQMTIGYLNNPKATAEAMDSEGWFHTGDVGYYDTEGYIYIVDRIKELIKVKGFQVAPAELEAVLRSHPGVEDAAVTGMPDERKGEVPIGFIKVKSQGKLSENDLKNFLSEKVAPFKMIHKYYFVDSIPKSPSGKILRKDLRVLLKTLQ